MAVRYPAFSLVLLAALLSGCRGGTASPSPGGFQEVFEGLARRGATVTQIVSGDPGCADPTLVANAVRFSLTLADGVSREVHLFGFRDDAALAAAQRKLDLCRGESLARTTSGAAIGSVRVSPFYAYGSPWSPPVEAALDAALREAAGGS